MPRVALTTEQRKAYKLKDLKGWVIMQMKLNHKRRSDLANVLGLSLPSISRMLKIPDPKKGENDRSVNPDPFSYGQILTLCEFFNVDDEEKKRLLTF